VTLIVRPRYPYIKQIKTNYEVQFLTDLVMNDKIKIIIKTRQKNYPSKLELTCKVLFSSHEAGITQKKVNKANHGV
jgi:hypothetical protein